MNMGPTPVLPLVLQLPAKDVNDQARILESEILASIPVAILKEFGFKTGALLPTNVKTTMSDPDNTEMGNGLGGPKGPRQSSQDEFPEESCQACRPPVLEPVRESTFGSYQVPSSLGLYENGF